MSSQDVAFICAVLIKAPGVKGRLNVMDQQCKETTEHSETHGVTFLLLDPYYLKTTMKSGGNFYTINKVQ